MQAQNLNVARLLRVTERVMKQWSGYATSSEERSRAEAAAVRFCPACGQSLPSLLSETGLVCDSCGRVISPDSDELSSMRSSLSWGDFVAGAAMGLLAYILGGMVWNTFHRW